MIASLWFAAYRVAWEIALPCLRLAAGCDARFGRITGASLIPIAWQVRERFHNGPSPHPGTLRPIWMHCASLGEAKGLWALAESLPPELPLLLTAVTPEGIGFFATRCAGPFRVACPAPFDHPECARRFLLGNRVRGLVLYEAELWPHWLRECRELGLPAVLVAGRLTSRGQRIYRGFGGAPARLLSTLKWIQAQSPADRVRFAAIVTAPVKPGFDFKAAHYLALRIPPFAPIALVAPVAPIVPVAPVAPVASVAPVDPVDLVDLVDLVAPSTPSTPSRTCYAFVSLHLTELRMVLPCLPKLALRGGIAIFPRRLSEMPAFLALLAPLGFAPHSREPGARLLLVDGFGHVQALLPTCHTAFIGGSLIPKGCHNLWEPLAAGARIRFGPHYQAQAALADALLEAGLARVLADPAQILAESPPGPGIPEACAAFAESLRERLEMALEECGKGIIATFLGQDPLGREDAPDPVREGIAR